MLDVRVCYPAGFDLRVRCGPDWDHDLMPYRLEQDGTVRVFRVATPAGRSQVYFKPVRSDGPVATWSIGPNYLAGPGDRTVYPHFDGGLAGRISEPTVVGRSRTVRVYTPPGYDENPLKRYPTLYMLDGANVFFSAEAFSGHEWTIDETMDCLDAMSMVDKCLVVALYSSPDRREAEYTAPGYGPLGQELVDEVLPGIAQRWRVLPGPETTAVMGASLGGVAALHLGLRHPDHFGMVACLSSTFGYRDDLLERIWRDPAPRTRIYVDSGWPADNHAETLEVFDALVARGMEPGRDVLFLGFPGALHHERSWAQRVHLPLQFFFGHAFRRRRPAND